MKSEWFLFAGGPQRISNLRRDTCHHWSICTLTALFNVDIDVYRNAPRLLRVAGSGNKAQILGEDSARGIKHSLDA